MNILFLGSDLIKGYHDPQSGIVDLVSSRSGSGGRAVAAGPDFALSVDEDGVFSHLLACVPGSSSSALDSALPTRPDEDRQAHEAEAEVVEDAVARWRLDASAGVFSVSFGDLEPLEWGRIGENLLWLALDADDRLAALVFEGVSRDPGGGAQATWLEEVGAG